MKKNIHIKHSGELYLKKSKYWFVTPSIVTIILFLFFWNSIRPNVELNKVIALIVLIFGPAFIFNYKRTIFFLSDFSCDGEKVGIRYFRKRNENELNTKLKDLDIRLKNASTRSGFNCEIHLKVDELKFIIDNTYDWNLTEMKELFLYIKQNKSEVLSDKEKFNLGKLEEKIKKSEATTKS